MEGGDPDFDFGELDTDGFKADVGFDGDDSGEASGEAAVGAGHSDWSTSGGGVAVPGGDAGWSMDYPTAAVAEEGAEPYSDDPVVKDEAQETPEDGGEEEEEDEDEDEDEDEEEDDDDEEDGEEEEEEGAEVKDEGKDDDGVDQEDGLDQESLASEHDDDEEREDRKEEDDEGEGEGDDDGAKGTSGKKRKKSIGGKEEEEEEKETKKKQRKTLGLDARKIRKIKDVSEETKTLQDREEERARWMRQRRETANAEQDKEIINPFADPSDQIRIHPVLAARLKPHQVEGVRFLWQRAMDGRDGKNPSGGLGSLAALEDGDRGSGCVLAHNMGLGKTFQVITFLHTIARNIPLSDIDLRRMLVLGPVNTLQNWKAELERWVPERGVLPGNKIMGVYILDEAGRTNKLRCDCLQKWFKEGGVMCMGYEMYRNLVQGTRVKDQDKKIKDNIQRFLRDPGPGILIADEGHLLRNHNSNVSKAVAAVKTKRRIVLTGSPLQNNLTEYHCMIDFISPGFLGTLNEFRNQFEIPIMNGEAKDAKPADVKRMKWRNHVLTKKLEPMIQRKDFTPLVQSLPPKFEFTLKIRLSEVQKKLYKYAISNRDECGMFSVLKAFHILLKIWNHPAVLCRSAKGEDTSKEGEEATAAAGRGNISTKQGLSGMANGNGMGVSHAYNPMWFKRILAEENITEEQLLDVDCSGKMLVLYVCVCIFVCISLSL